MLEQEIKLHIPGASRAGVLKQLSALPGPRRVRLRAMYFDTPDRQLGRQQAALRLRLEGRRWVQTFKMAGADTMSRLELNHLRSGPELDLSVYAGTPAEKVLQAVGKDLQVRYETDVMRLGREVRTRTGTVELACDVGVFRAGDIELPISELEFELKKGKPAALFTLAQRWRMTHGLKLDLRSKAERGDTLATAWLAQQDSPDRIRDALVSYAMPRRQSPVRLARKGTPDAALRVITSECLDQMNRNALLLYRADGLGLDPELEAEAVHQWRIALRRLRSAWTWFNGQAVLPPREWREEARALFGAMGAQRDDHVLHAEVMPLLLQAGMPALAPSAVTNAKPAPTELLDLGEYEDWFMRLYQWTVTLPVQPVVAARRVGMAQSAAARSPGSASELHELQPSGSTGQREEGPKSGSSKAVAADNPYEPLLRKLRKWHRKIVKKGRQFEKITDQERHELRKLGKRLRYNLNFAETLLPARPLKNYRQQLVVVQEVLGQINDLVTARAALLERVAAEPQAWFGVGWISAQLSGLYGQAREEFAKMEKLKPFWGKRL